MYVLEHFGSGTVSEVADRYGAIAASDAALRALEYLAEDFASIDHVGAVRAARFRTGRPDADRQAAAFGYVQEFLRRVRRG